MKYINFTDIPMGFRPESKVWQVLTEQASKGQATLFQEGTAFFVQFDDEPEPIRFEDLAYDKQIGLYDKRQFPNI
jgi:hypothetical protein